MCKKGWVSYRMSPRIEQSKTTDCRKTLQKEVHVQQNGIFPAFFQPHCLFFSESRLYLDIFKQRPGKVGILRDKDP